MHSLAIRQTWAKNTKAYHKRQTAKGLCISCPQPAHLKYRYCEIHLQDLREYHKAKMAAYKKQIYDAFGNQCLCCKETTAAFLTIDHLQGGGRHHRRYGNLGVYRDIIKEGFPKDKYALMCMNCNFGKFMNHGVCPHTTSSEVI